jgi:hypothetical protein
MHAIVAFLMSTHGTAHLLTGVACVLFCAAFFTDIRDGAEIALWTVAVIAGIAAVRVARQRRRR